VESFYNLPHSLPGQVLNFLAMTKQEIAIKNAKILGKIYIRLAKHQAMVAFIWQNHEVADYPEETQRRFV